MLWRKTHALGDTAQFPLGTTYELRLSRSKTLLTQCAQALVNMNCGWQLDSARHSSVTDYEYVMTRNDNGTYPCLMFTNSISGCKLMMAYVGGDTINDGLYSYGEDNYGYSMLIHTPTDSDPVAYHSGLCISIIPAHSSDNFDDPDDPDNFIPSSATPICGTVYGDDLATAHQSAAYAPESGTMYTYWIGATPYAVAVYAGHTDDWGDEEDDPPLKTPIYITGKIFGDLAHSTVETTPQAKYGTLVLRTSTGTHEGESDILASTYTNKFGVSGDFTVPGFSLDCNVWDLGSHYYAAGPCGALCDKNGNWRPGLTIEDSNVYNVIAFTVAPEVLAPPAFYQGVVKTRWTPLAMTILTNNPLGGVVQGDGFKGYLDTDLIRVAVATRGQTFENDKFICVENGTNLLISWDAGNPTIG